MTLFTENPFPLVLICLLVIGASFGASLLLKKPKLVWGGVAGIVVLIALLAIAHFIVTDKEQMTNIVHSMASCVRRNDVNGLLEYVSEDGNNNSPKSARRRIENEMPDYTFRACRISNVKVEIDQESNRATVSFMAFVNVDATKRYDYDGIARRQVILTFQKEEDGKWRIIFFDHMDPIRMGL